MSERKDVSAEAVPRTPGLKECHYTNEIFYIRSDDPQEVKKEFEDFITQKGEFPVHGLEHWEKEVRRYPNLDGEVYYLVATATHWWDGLNYEVKWYSAEFFERVFKPVWVEEREKH